MEKTTTAILLATYNGARYLREQIESIYAQTYQDWTLYVHDDGSTDGTQEILAEYANTKANFVVLDYPSQHGAKANFMSLLKMVEASYYFFTDQDDVWLPNKIEVCMQQMLQTERENVNSPQTPILVCCDVCVVDEALHPIAPSLWQYSGTHPEFLTTFAESAATPFVTGCTMLINHRVKEVVLWHKLSKAVMHDTFITLCALKAQGKVVPIFHSLMLYRQHGLNTLGAYSKTMNTWAYKLRHLKTVWHNHTAHWRMLKALGYGSWFKFMKYKRLYKKRCHNVNS